MMVIVINVFLISILCFFMVLLVLIMFGGLCVVFSILEII